MFSSASSFFSCCLAPYLKDLRLINRLFVFFCLVRGNWVIVLSNAELLVLTAGCQWASEVWQYRVARAISHKKVWPRWVHSCETFFFFFSLCGTVEKQKIQKIMQKEQTASRPPSLEFGNTNTFPSANAIHRMVITIEPYHCVERFFYSIECTPWWAIATLASRVMCGNCSLSQFVGTPKCSANYSS